MKRAITLTEIPVEEAVREIVQHLAGSNIKSFNATTYANHIDVTSFGSAQEYITGAPRTTIDIVTYSADALQCFREDIPFLLRHETPDRIISATVRLTSVQIDACVDGLMEYCVQGEVIGGLMVEDKYVAPEPAPDEIPGRRAIQLERLT